MMLSAEGLRGVDLKNEVSEEVAKSFTANIGEIAKTHESIAGLRILLDLTFLSELLRQVDIKTTSLSGLASIEHRSQSVNQWYPAVKEIIAEVPDENSPPKKTCSICGFAPPRPSFHDAAMSPESHLKQSWSLPH